MHIKTTVRFHITLVRMAIVNKSTNNCWQRCGGRKGNIFALLAGMQIGAATVESNMEMPQKIKNGSAYLPSNSISVNISEETQNTN